VALAQASNKLRVLILFIGSHRILALRIVWLVVAQSLIDHLQRYLALRFGG